VNQKISSDYGGRFLMVKEVKDILNTEKALKMSQVQLENAMEIANLASWEFDILNNRYILNDRFYTMIGTSAIKEGGYTMSSEDYFNRFIHPMMWSLF
jgi:hypothetical protein